METGTLVRVETRPDLGDCLVLANKRDGLHMIMTNVIRDEFGVAAPWPLEAKHVFWIDGSFLFPARYA